MHEMKNENEACLSSAEALYPTCTFSRKDKRKESSLGKKLTCPQTREAGEFYLSGWFGNGPTVGAL